MLRTSVRELTFPDGVKRRVEAYRLVWAWFDRSDAYEFGPDADELLAETLHYQACVEKEITLGEALGWVLEDAVSSIEASGADFTDDPFKLMIAKRQIGAFDSGKRE